MNVYARTPPPPPPSPPPLRVARHRARVRWRVVWACPHVYAHRTLRVSQR